MGVSVFVESFGGGVLVDVSGVRLVLGGDEVEVLAMKLGVLVQRRREGEEEARKAGEVVKAVEPEIMPEPEPEPEPMPMPEPVPVVRTVPEKVKQVSPKASDVMIERLKKLGRRV